MTEQRYLLTVFHQAGPDSRIVKGADGALDYVSAEQLELAAWRFMKGPRDIGFFHADGTIGHAEVVESYIYRGPDWPLTADDGSEVVIKSGDWLGGLLLDDIAWQLKKSGRIGGVSIDGRARRRRPARSTP